MFGKLLTLILSLAILHRTDGQITSAFDSSTCDDTGAAALPVECKGCQSGSDPAPLAPMTTGTGACQPIYWIPPAAASTEFEVISDEDHFPHTTFPAGGPTTVKYEFWDGGVAAQSLCEFTVTTPAGPCDPPINDCPKKNIVVETDNGADEAIVTWTEVTTDAPATISVADGCLNAGNSYLVGSYRCAYTATASDGDESFCIFYVIVKRQGEAVSAVNLQCDPITKTLDPPALTLSVQDDLDAIINGAYDAEGDIQSVDTSQPTNYEFPLGTSNFLISITDNEGNTVACNVAVTIERPFDDQSPVISNCPAGVTVYHATGDVVAKGSWTQPTADDNVLLVGFTCNIIPVNYLEIPSVAPFTSTVTCTATDWKDLQSVCEFDLTFTADVIAPTIANCNNYTEYTTQQSGSIVVNYPEPVITDNSGEYELTVEGGASGSMFVAPRSINRITYTVTDIGGNVATCSFTVEVREDEFPVFTNCPVSFTVNTTTGETSAEVSWDAPEITDDNQLDTDNVEISINPGLEGIVLEPDEDIEVEMDKGVYTVTYSYVDVNLQSGLCSFEVNVKDAEAPNIQCPEDIDTTLDSGEQTTVVEWVTPAATDNDNQVVEVELKDATYTSGREFSSGSYNIIYVATDQADNEGFCSFIVTVNAYDTGNFWIGCPDDMQVETIPGESYSTAAWNAPQLRAGIDQPRIVNSYPENTRLFVGDTRIEYTAYDAAENSDSCVFTVTVLDNEPPVITSCPGDCVVYVVSGRTAVPVYWQEPRTSDNSGSTVTLNASPFGSGTEFGIGSSQVYYSAVDPSGNSVTGCTFQISVIETAASFTVSGNAEFSSIRGVSSSSAISQSTNLAEDLDRLFRQNTAISKILAGVQVGTPNQLSGGVLSVPINLILHECRAAFLHIRDSLTQNLQGNNRDSFDSGNVIDHETFQLNTKEFLLTLLKIDQDLNLPVGDQSLVYNGDYSNPRTSAYQYLAERVCDTMDQLFSSFTGYCGCAVWRFSPGSIVTDAIIIFNGNSAVSQSALEDQIGNSISSGNNGLNNLILQDFTQTDVLEVCPESYCQNGGTCEPNPSTYLSQCDCAPGYGGTQCQTDLGQPPVIPTDAPDDGFNFTTEAIIGIVVGTVGGLLLLIILLACFCVFCLRPAPGPKSQPIINQPGEPVYAVQPPRQNVQIRDVVERPPIARPYPVRVPARFPVPVPQRVPVPFPQPIPRPFPVAIRSPVPVPVQFPVPIRQPFPQPFPVAIPQQVAIPRNVPFPTRVPFAVPNPVPFPQPFGVPIREQVPVYQFGNGMNLASRQPFGPGIGNGFGSRLGPNLNGFNNGYNGLNGGF